MHIMLTNDDGVYAPGLLALARALSRRHTLTIVAPDRERSATSHSMTLDRPLSAKAVELEIPNATAFAVNGTPVDCVHLGIGPLADRTPDLLVSGINNGFNLGGDISYSGTVHAALEGASYGVRSVALSLGVRPADQKSEAQSRFAGAAKLSSQIIDALPLRSLDRHVLNINFPFVLSDPENPQIRVCPQGVSMYETAYRRMDDPFGKEFYWVFASEGDGAYNEKHKTDVFWASQGYVTVTPLLWNATDRAGIEDTTAAFAELALKP